ncbi:hypothetical protein KQR14_14200, partial [Staphylococcus aureus]|uniref:hypothetical protein n=1 Tax=Staphylococcus aureus TaxID=1280 RepID=UPI001C1DE22E
KILQTMQVGGAPTKRISKENSTENASWLGPNKENFESKFYRQCKLGRGPNISAEFLSAYNNVQVGLGPSTKSISKGNYTDNVSWGRTK